MSQVKQKKKQSDINWLKLEPSFETSFLPMWHKTKTWKYLELISSTKTAKCSFQNVFFTTYYYVKIEELQ